MHQRVEAVSQAEKNSASAAILPVRRSVSPTATSSRVCSLPFFLQEATSVLVSVVTGRLNYYRTLFVFVNVNAAALKEENTGRLNRTVWDKQIYWRL